MTKDVPTPPHEVARRIAQQNLQSMRDASTNVERVGGGEQAAAAFLAEITRGLCSNCARLAVDPETKQIGCSFDFNSPSALARQLLGGTFLHEQHCDGYTADPSQYDVFIDPDGIIRYKYR
jgi:hypothetical protein